MDDVLRKSDILCLLSDKESAARSALDAIYAKMGLAVHTQPADSTLETALAPLRSRADRLSGQVFLLADLIVGVERMSSTQTRRDTAQDILAALKNHPRMGVTTLQASNATLEALHSVAALVVAPPHVPPSCRIALVELLFAHYGVPRDAGERIAGDVLRAVYGGEP